MELFNQCSIGYMKMETSGFHFNGNSSITDPNYNKNYIGIIHYSSNPYYARIDGTAAEPTFGEIYERRNL
ncbi:MAG: hypothetical protein R2852_05645 [Bacteroidia bacterium]